VNALFTVLVPKGVHVITVDPFRGSNRSVSLGILIEAADGCDSSVSFEFYVCDTWKIITGPLNKLALWETFECNKRGAIFRKFDEILQHLFII